MFLYCIKNKINNNRYIGVTSGKLSSRLFDHAREAKNKKNRPFYNAINIYNINNFELEFSIDYTNQVEDYQELEEIEQHFIKKYNTYTGFENCQGYNQTYGGFAGSFGYSRAGKIKRYDLKTLKVLEIYPSMADAQRKTGVLKSDINQCCIPKGRSRSAGRYGWCYYNDVPKKYKNKCAKEIKQFDLNTLEVINTFDSVTEASNKTKIHRQSITNCCTGWSRMAGNFGWCYINETPSNKVKINNKWVVI
jgi:group I intron endonuclease